MSENTLVSAFHKPRSLDEQQDSIHQASADTAIGRIKLLAANQDGQAPDQVLLILENVLTREVRSNPQRRGVIQALKRGIDKTRSAITAASLELLTGGRGAKPVAPKTAEATVTTEQPRRPEWDAVRETVSQISFHGRMFLRGQVKLGMLLAALKKANGIREGRPAKNSPDSGQFLPWKTIVMEETGLERQRADEFIRLFDATTAKLKKAKKLALPAAVKKSALVLFQESNALSLTPEQWTLVDEVIGTLTTGETQASLMQELGIVAKPKAMPKKKPGEEEEQEEETAGQLAFIFFSTIASPLVNARTDPHYKARLLALPLHSDSEHPLSLSSLEAEFRAALADIEDAKQANAKPAKGRTIEAA